MDKFRRDIEDQIAKSTTTMPDSEMRDIGIKWAMHSLRVFDDTLLLKALKISAAISDFCNELEKAGQGE